MADILSRVRWDQRVSVCKRDESDRCRLRTSAPLRAKAPDAPVSPIRRFVIRTASLCALAIAPAVAGTIGSTAASPTAVAVGAAGTVTVTSIITDPSLVPGSVVLQRLNASGQVEALLGTLHDDGLNGDITANDGTYTLQTVVYENNPGSVTLRVAAGFKGQLLLTYAPPILLSITGTGIGINIKTPANLLYTSLSPVSVTGTVSDPRAIVTVNGINAPVTAGQFLATVPLVEGVNTLTAVATNSNATVTTASVQVTLDTTPPHITIDAPQSGATTAAASITVTGTANDVVVGTVNGADVQVTVNGIAAQVSNRSYVAANVPLSLGVNTIQAVGRDKAGNGTTVTAAITRIPPSQPPPPPIGGAVITDSLNIVSGNGQTGTIGAALLAPLVVSLTSSSGTPVAGQPVVFSVTNNNGTVSAASAPSGSAVVNTDGNGQAQVTWTLGQHSGAASNTVQVSTPLAVGPVTFSATGTTSKAALINVDSGNNQSGALSQPLAFPLVAVVTDSGYNRVPNVPVVFTVTQGGGNLAGLPTQVVNTDSNGRAITVLTLGSQPGNDNNVVTASFSGNPGLPAAFTASALTPGDPANTSITGVVLDNSNNPIPGVTIRLFLTNQANNNNLPQQIGTPVQTNTQGTFLIAQAPVGYFKLMADGTTAISQNAFPTLEYDLVTVAGQNNTLGMPIYLPALDTVDRLCVSATQGGTLTLPQVPGFSLTVSPGSATFPGGSKTGCVSVTPVNSDKVPMAPGFGQQPRFIVTIQPVGATFNPPAAMTVPNVDGLAPRSVTEMYSYDHDLGMFVAIGTGTVSGDGSVVASHPGTGVVKAGWHASGNPNPTGGSGGMKVTLSPTQITTGKGSTVTVTANGTPAANGSYRWEILATQPFDNTSIATLTSAPACAGLASCTLSLTGTGGGRATLRVHFVNSTSGAEVTADARLTVVQVVSVTWTISHIANCSQCAGVLDFPDDTNTITSTSTDFTANPPLVLPRKTESATLSCNTVPSNTDPDVYPILHWKAIANPSGPATPALQPVPFGGNAILSFDAQGSFNTFCFADSNRNGLPDVNESQISLNLVLVGITINTFVPTPHPSLLAQSTPNSGGVQIQTGGVGGGFNFAQTDQSGFYLSSTITLTGGGSDGKLGADKITVFFMQDFKNDTYAGNYQDSRTLKEVFLCGGATLAICSGSPAFVPFPVLDDAVEFPFGGQDPAPTTCCHQETNVGADPTMRKIEWLDSPGFNSPALQPCDTTKTVVGTSGSNAFAVYMMAYGQQAPHTYVAMAEADWTVTPSGTVSKDTSGNYIWTPDSSAGITAGQVDTGYPKNANGASIMVYGPTSLGGSGSLSFDGR